MHVLKSLNIAIVHVLCMTNLLFYNRILQNVFICGPYKKLKVLDGPKVYKCIINLIFLILKKFSKYMG